MSDCLALLGLAAIGWVWWFGWWTQRERWTPYTDWVYRRKEDE